MTDKSIEKPIAKGHLPHPEAGSLRIVTIAISGEPPHRVEFKPGRSLRINAFRRDRALLKIKQGTNRPDKMSMAAMQREIEDLQ